jgi:diguanylate cyclase (GGDEF)-like protein
MAPSMWVGRLAWVGLVVTMVVIGAGTLAAGMSVRHQTNVAATQSALDGAYDDAADAVAAQIAIERRYQLRPDPGLRNALAQEETRLDGALIEVVRNGTGRDRRTVTDLRNAYILLNRAIQRMLEAVDAGNHETVLRIETDDLAPAFDKMHGLLVAAGEQSEETSDRAVDDLQSLEAIMFVTVSVLFLLGLAFIAGCMVLISRFQRRLVEQADASHHQATHDSLTGLPNRALFADRLSHVLADGTPVAVMLLDLDRFKEVNDTLGHSYGDDLLRSVAERLGGMLRDSDTVARLSGDEFAVLLPGVGATDGHDLADRVLDELHRSYPLGDVTVDIEISIGIAVAPGHAGEVEELMRCADLAMYSAKDAKTGVVMYDPGTLVHQPSRLLLLGDLRRALERQGELTLHYQPKVGLDMDRLCGVEALVRWNHPVRGMVSPAEFIPIAESTGLINRLTVHVLELALRQVRQWLDDGHEIPVAVNLSPRCLLDTAMLDTVRNMLARHGVAARMLRLEVTETAVMGNPALALDTLTGLHELGVRLAIDDYGTGYSSMAYLKKLPVDELKVDRSFILNMTASENDAVLVRSAIDLGHNLGLTVVAEGVETAEHVQALRHLGCDIAQGYHFARPMPADEVLAWLRASGRASRVAVG